MATCQAVTVVYVVFKYARSVKWQYLQDILYIAFVHLALTLSVILMLFYYLAPLQNHKYTTLCVHTCLIV